MGRRMIVMAPEADDFIVPLDRFVAAAGHWAPYAQVRDESTLDGPSDATIWIERPGDTFFQIVHFRNERMISTDGTPEQAAEVAVWAADTFPMTADGELWFVDQGYSGHVVLRPGMSPRDVLDGWQPHDDDPAIT